MGGVSLAHLLFINTVHMTQYDYRENWKTSDISDIIEKIWQISKNKRSVESQ